MLADWISQNGQFFRFMGIALPIGFLIILFFKKK